MIPFTAPVEDILFSLEHVAGADRLNDFDFEMHREIAEHFAAFAEGVLAQLNGPGDREGASLLNGRVRMPSGFKAAYDQFCAQGWVSWTGMSGRELRAKQRRRSGFLMT